MTCCCGRRGCCPRISSILLAHVNLLLVLFSGAGFAAAARLKWDPSAYVPLREVLPLEYRLVCGALLAGALATLFLAHLAIGALFVRRSPRLRRALLYIYALLTLLQLAGEVAGAVWAYCRINAWIATRDAQELLDLLKARDHIVAALQLLVRWYPLPKKLTALVEEAEADLPRNGYAAGGAAAALLTLQAAGAVLAVAAACRARAAHALPRPSLTTLDSDHDHDDSRSRLTYHTGSRPGKIRTTYKNGRMVMV